MELDKLDITARKRTNWESIDLGFAMTRNYFKSIYKPWLIACTALFIACYPLFYISPTLAGFVFWFFLPVAERIVLYVVSRTVFNSPPDCRTTLKALGEEWHKGFFKQLFIHRFSPGRAYLLPVWQLEGLSGKKESQRIEILKRRTASTANNFGLIFVHFEWIFIYSLLILSEVFSVRLQDTRFDESSLDAMVYGELPMILYHTSYISYFIIVASIRPFYCSACFSLYLNRRIDLEGWDIELQFKSLANRFLKQTAKILPLFLGALILFTPSEIMAQNKDPQKIIKEIKADKKYSEYEDKSEWFLEQDKDNDPVLPEWFASVIKILAILIFTGLIAWLIYSATKIKRTSIKQEYKEELPERIMGMDIRKQSIPKDVYARSMQLLKNGQVREAYSLLYRATLSNMIHNHNCKLKNGFTEEDCLRSVTQQVSSTAVVDFFRELTLNWQKLAYAHSQPELVTSENLCLSWKTLFTKENLNDS
ncbi:MAG: hypothetical protein MK132_02425 [Lentisphaerales bacterium]|nr:hypothetical protein [Lentisphaerales bacterium]